MPNNMVMIHADILKVTKKFVTVRCGESEEILKIWEVEAEEPLEAGQVDMELRIPKATAEALGLSDGDGMPRATVTEFNPGTKSDGIRCQDCVNYCEDENDVSDVCNECTRFGHDGGIKDNFASIIPDAKQKMDITLTILDFSEDGEIATVEDRHGNTADLSTAAFTHDAEDISVGDTLLCHVLTSAVEPTDLCPDETPEDEEDDPRPAHGHGSTWLRKDICEKSFPLSDDEKLELGDTMAKAQEKIDALEDELQSIRKSFKARIEEQQEILSKAAKEYRDGKTEPQKVECDVFQDWSTDELVYVTADEAAEEIMRRPMTDDEKRPTLFDAPPDGKGHSAPLGEDPRHQDTPAPTPPTWGHTCIDCTHMANGQDGAQAGECASCVQSGSGTLDNWQPRRECRTCNYSRTQIHMPPCNTCLRNVEERYRGDDDNWIWAGPGSAGNAPEDEASPGLTVDANAADVPPMLPDESSQGAALQ